MKISVEKRLKNDLMELDQEIKEELGNLENAEEDVDNAQRELAYLYAKKDALKKYLGIPLSSKQSSGDA